MWYWPVALNHTAPRAEREGRDKAGEEEECVCVQNKKLGKVVG